MYTPPRNPIYHPVDPNAMDDTLKSYYIRTRINRPWVGLTQGTHDFPTSVVHTVYDKHSNRILHVFREEYIPGCKVRLYHNNMPIDAQSYECITKQYKEYNKCNV
jgi:hypothetical protein